MKEICADFPITVVTKVEEGEIGQR